jgi:hypothetical protein
VAEKASVNHARAKGGQVAVDRMFFMRLEAEKSPLPYDMRTWWRNANEGKESKEEKD